MSKYTTITAALLFIFCSATAQKIDYDNSSKWYLGFNMGATWQTTDVANKTNVGYGLTLGKSFNYNYGKRTTFDIRMRYLRGYWYGQDNDTTSLVGYTGSALKQYKDTFGFSVNNFQADVHRLALELVLHANGVRERSGWDPYIFGGIGFTWYQTFGDLINQDSIGGNGMYNYAPAMLSQSYINSTLDGIYDSALDGNNKSTFNVGVMPSIGIGIGYQVGKRVSLGLEHKTTFTLVDNFDGYVDPSSKYNDIYHYTSAFINFRFRSGGHGGGRVDNLNTGGGGTTNNLTGCNNPTVVYVTPSRSTVSSTSMTYTVSAEVKDVRSKESIVFKHNGVSTLNFTYNVSTKMLEAPVVLTQGENTFEIVATNSCGNTTKSVSLNFSPCLAPVVAWINPTNNTNMNVTSPAFNLSAMVQNITGNDQVSVMHNSQLVNNFNFDTKSGKIDASVSLLAGSNTFTITVTNNCGTTSESVSITYQGCIPPSVSLMPGVNNGATVSNPNFTLNASVLNYTNGQSLTVTQNGKNNNFNYNSTNNALQGNYVLVPGLNTFVVTAVNSCGTDTKTFTVNYRNCNSPTISVISPNSNNSIVDNPTFSYSATVNNVNSGQSVKVQQNGKVVSSTFSTASRVVSGTVTLVNGVNTFAIIATNECGSVTETFTVNYIPCVAPVIAITSPVGMNSSTTNSSLNFTATVTNGQTASVTQNGSLLESQFTSSNGKLATKATLRPGVNTFVVTATNACGTTTETVTVTLADCPLPVISVSSPVGMNSSTTNSSLNFAATVTNGQTASVTQNGSLLESQFTSSNGKLATKATLRPGVNTFVVTATNACGTTTETVTVNFEECSKPVINLLNPTALNTEVSNASFSFSAAIQNVINAASVNTTMNGGAVNGIYNVASKTLNGAVTLNKGSNVFVITAKNDCGTATLSFTVKYKEPEVDNQKITICHYPPGNTDNPQTIEIPLSAWPAHQAHGDKLGPCDTGNTGGQGNGNSGGNSGNQGGNSGNTDNPNQKITICHYPPGNTDNPQTIEIPLSAWPAHQAHGDKLGPCDTGNSGGQGNGNSGGNSGNQGGNSGSSNSNSGSGNSGSASQGNGNTGSQSGNSGSSNANSSSGNTNTNSGSGNGNNGHGNNTDGIDSSNPGKGKGGPGSRADGSTDDENSKGSGKAAVKPTTSGGTSNSSGSATKSTNAPAPDKTKTTEPVKKTETNPETEQKPPVKEEPKTAPATETKPAGSRGGK